MPIWGHQLINWDTGHLLPHLPCCQGNWFLFLWDPGGGPCLLGMNATFPICKSEVAAVVGPTYILLLSLLAELVTEQLSTGKLSTPLWYGNAEIFRYAIGSSGASCGDISTSKFTVIHRFEQDACPSARTVGAVGKPPSRFTSTI
jgi:hypothetical protein